MVSHYREDEKMKCSECPTYKHVRENYPIHGEEYQSLLNKGNELPNSRRLSVLWSGKPGLCSMSDILSDIFVSETDNVTSALMHEKTSFFDLVESCVEREPSKSLQLVGNNNMIQRDMNSCMPSPDQCLHLKLPFLEPEPEQFHVEEPCYKEASFQHPSSRSLETGLENESSFPLLLSSIDDNIHGIGSTIKDSQTRCSRPKNIVCDVSGLIERYLPTPVVSSASASIGNKQCPVTSPITLIKQEQLAYRSEAVNPQQTKKLRTSKQHNEEKSPRMTHIAVERNRRKQMNEHLAILRSLMPGSYVKRNDQASIIGGVVEFVNELQQLMQLLEGQKQRRNYADALSPRTCVSPRPSLSPRFTHSVAPSPKLSLNSTCSSQQIQNLICISPSKFTCRSPKSDTFEPVVTGLVANSKSPLAEVNVKISGSNALLKTMSQKAPGQLARLVMALEDLCFEIIHLNITTVEDTVLYAFTLKIGIDCRLGVDDLASEVHQFFSEMHNPCGAHKLHT